MLLSQGSRDWLSSLGKLLESFVTEEDEEKLNAISRRLEYSATELSRALKQSKEAVESMEESLHRIQSDSELVAAVLQKVTKLRRDV
ncbi:uncharacterized protein Gasu_64520 [Galdieria sulphuraria]|uniref:Uncharacterized protein n=1 Tax=Galdieria sulphuraria TaxID=130081 RepID=M2XR47_GALSU|nr:uncharacterized protein Gasu_64520 [Galdieria sulphuraria]EME25889.1 hypothetical protein Gasu_64520 [Galdieria sulphuraria]|eukprot:XP_005702409.1 hypothetical protein Gasu_64520 [Galdieria sulphuraria]